MGWRRLKGFMNEIIQFGAVKTDNLNILDTFDIHIGWEDLAGDQTLLIFPTRLSGCQFMQAVSRFKRDGWATRCWWHGEPQIFWLWSARANGHEIQFKNISFYATFIIRWSMVSHFVFRCNGVRKMRSSLNGSCAIKLSGNFVCRHRQTSLRREVQFGKIPTGCKEVCTFSTPVKAENQRQEAVETE